MFCRAWHENLAGLVVLVDHARIGTRQLCGPGSDRAQHSLKIQRRTDRLSDLAEGAKLANRPRQLLGPGLELTEQPRVLDGDDPLIGEGRYQLDLLLGERSDFVPMQAEYAQKNPVPDHWHRQDRPKPTDPVKLGQLVLGIRCYIGHLNRSALKRGSADPRSSPRRDRGSFQKFPELRRGTVNHRHAVHFALRPEDDTPLRAAKPRRVLKECCQYRLKIERRATDDLEDLCGGSLLIECLGEITIAGLQLREQADVFNRNHRLIREGLEQSNLPLAKKTSFSPPDHDCADRDARSHQGNAQQRPKTKTPSNVAARRKFVCLRLQVGDVKNSPLQHRSAGRAPTFQGAKILADGSGGGDRAVVGDQAQPVAVRAVDGDVVRLAEPGRALHHRVEHRLYVRRRPSDDAENLAGCRLLTKQLGQLSVTRLQLLEQPHILNRDDGLVSEGLEQLNLSIGKWTNNGLTNKN